MRERSTKTPRRIIMDMAIAIGVGVVLYVVVSPLILLFGDTDGPRIRLLYKTDHRALLEACGDLSRRAIAGELKPGMYYVHGRDDPRVRTFPQFILALNPSNVTVDSLGKVTVAIAAGLNHFGVHAYPESYPSSPDVRLGDKKLMEGLWYYDEGYDERPDDWDEHIEKLRPKAKHP